jgi:hypothetical protein
MTLNITTAQIKLFRYGMARFGKVDRWCYSFWAGRATNCNRHFCKIKKWKDILEWSRHIFQTRSLPISLRHWHWCLFIGETYIFEQRIALQMRIALKRERRGISWTNCAFGLYPSSGVSKTEELKIYIPNITIHTSTKFTPGSITNHRATYLGAYTHKPLKQVRHWWQ